MRRLARALASVDLTPVATLPPVTARPAFLADAYATMRLRCLCPECLRLDAAHPGEGYQLALFPYRREFAPDRRAAGA